MRYRLGVDLGTTFTAAAVDDGTGPAMLGLGNRALTVPSVVYLSPDGTFLFGEAAERRAATEPSRSQREFKRRIGDTVPVLLAGQPFSPQAICAKVLVWVASVATERQGAAPEEIVVTYPANWGGYKRELLRQVVTLADLPEALTCTEPEAAAAQYASRAGLSPGEKVAVYDLGGGTFDVCVLEMHDHGFAIIGSPDGVEHLGGIDFDEAIFQLLVEMLEGQLADLDMDDPDVVGGLARLRRECVDAKEALSSDVEATVAVGLPGLTTQIRITRRQLEGLIGSPLRDTLDAMRRALRSAHVEAADLSTIVLVGGSSRIPLVSHLLQNEFGVLTAMDTHPKHDIALGALRYHPSSAGDTAPPAAPTVVTWPTRSKDSPEPSSGKTEPVAEYPIAPPVWKPPGSGDDESRDGLGSLVTAAAGRLRRPKPVLLAIGAAVIVLLVGASAYALTRGEEDVPIASDPATSTSPSTEITCWDDTIEHGQSFCPPPTGADGMAAVFPSFDNTCRSTPIEVTSKLEAFVCHYGSYLVRYSRWPPTADRVAYYTEANPGAETAEWSTGGEDAGTQWTSYNEDPLAKRPYQWSATYDDHPFSVSVEATSAAGRAEGISHVSARPPSQIGLR